MNPAGHVFLALGAAPGQETTDTGGDLARLRAILPWPRAPYDAYVVTHYGRDHWIDGAAFAAKYAFTVLQDLMALGESTDSAKAPVLTIPAS